ncbi:UvrD-helicase domain-containing protein [Aeromicrobium sp. Sec7.5]|uniref:UvrD-helicase domain-containing protein n=1 Tax=Aeromicrobium sp. Sec7.5 TaxID=3121276 RepID=UPI002FE4F249
MAAGDSALREGSRLSEEADALFELAESMKAKSRNYLAAASSEAGLAPALRALAELGWHVLEDRLWPNSRRANLDFVLVGPGGLLVVDAKSWAEVRVHDGGIYRGQESCEDDLDNVDRLIDALTEGLEHIGLTSAAITVVWAFSQRSIDASVRAVKLVGARDLVEWIARLPRRFTDAQAESVSAALAEICPAIESEPPLRLPLARHRGRSATVDTQEVLPGIDDLVRALLDAELTEPIESWMTFLHPDQVRLTRTHWNGPARVRGPAGTGKTVVGLHRATHHALRSPHPIIFTTLVRTLPQVFAELARIVSEPASHNIHFVGVHQLASECLQKVGEHAGIDSAKVNTAFALAWSRSDLKNSSSIGNRSPAYWQEEIDYVIKGRGLTEFEQYRDLQRIGRKTPLRLGDRERMWDLFVAYQEQLRLRGTYDFNDLILRAHETVRRFPSLFQFSGVVVDEVQDLNLISLRFLDTLAGDGPNRLLLLGDSRQSVYPGGFTLSEAGINVTGRAHVLRENYRNTAQILAAAAALVVEDAVLDIEGTLEDRLEGTSSRVGGKPTVATGPDSQALASMAIDSMIAARACGASWGNMAALTRTTREARQFTTLLRHRGIPVVPLADYAGVTTEAVKVGTIKRAKGLEFSRVYLPAIRHDLPRHTDESDSSYDERNSLYRREIYVAMTRARDHLWAGYIDETITLGKVARGTMQR